MYKLLALDVDGTLINRRLEITKSTFQAIKAAQRHGVLVTLATGRSFHSARQYAQHLSIDVPLICANGGIIRHTDGDIIDEQLLPAALAADLAEEMLAAGLFVQAYHRGGIAYQGNRMTIWRWMHVICDKVTFRNFCYAVQEVKRSRLHTCSNLVDSIRQGSLQPHKLFVTGENSKLEQLCNRCKEQNMAVAFYPGYNGCMYLEIMAAGASKGAALGRLANWLGVELEQVVAVGDNLNDTEMVEAAGLGVAMGNGHEDLKQLAAHVTLSNDEDGVAAVIRDYILAPDRIRSGTAG